MKLERTPSILIDSFAQTDTHEELLDTATGGASSSDMVDSGVDSQHKGIFKERNISVTEDDELLSFNEDRFRNDDKSIIISLHDLDKNIIMSEDEDEADKNVGTSTAEDRKEDIEEVSLA